MKRVSIEAMTETRKSVIRFVAYQLDKDTHRVVVTVPADEGHTGIAGNIRAAFTHQITKRL